MDISLSELTNSFQTRRARWRLRQRRASILVLPSACFLAELSRWGMAAALGDGDAVKGAVELTVAAAIEAVADAVARGGGDRGDARQAGELGIAGKAPRAGGLGEELGRSQGAAALQGEQLGSLGFDQGTDLAFELGGPAGAATDLGDQLAGHPHAGALLGAGELAGHPIQPDHAVQGTGGDLQLGPEVVPVPAQAALVFRAGFDEVLAVVEQELDLQGVLVEVGGGQGLRALT